MPRAGRLNRRIELQEPTPTQDEFGGDIEGFTTVATVWASIDVPRSQSSAEIFVSDKVTSQITHDITIRYRSDITALWQLKLGSRQWRIILIRNKRDGFRELTLVSREILSGEPV